MLSKHIKKIEPIIEELKGKRIEKVDGVLIPEYLYSFPNGLWLSFDLDKRDNYFDVKLGRIFSLDDVMPRLIVLEGLLKYTTSSSMICLKYSNFIRTHTTTFAQTKKMEQSIFIIYFRNLFIIFVILIYFRNLLIFDNFVV